MGPCIRKRDSNGAYYSIINDLRLMDKEDFRKYLQMNTSTFQVIYVSVFTILVCRPLYLRFLGSTVKNFLQLLYRNYLSLKLFSRLLGISGVSWTKH